LVYPTFDDALRKGQEEVDEIELEQIEVKEGGLTKIMGISSDSVARGRMSSFEPSNQWRNQSYEHLGLGAACSNAE
jgi:hypothetical protein